LERIGLGVEQMLRRTSSAPIPGSRPWIPELRIFNRPRDVVLRLVSSEIDPRKIRIQLSGRTLTLSAAEDHQGYRAFRRSVVLPETIDASRISARAGGHILTVRIWKRQATP
jgi:HSP20 family molecular chaperone IbpA